MPVSPAPDAPAAGTIALDAFLAVDIRGGTIVSEVPTLGCPDTGGAVVLFAPDTPVPNGGRLF